MTGLERVKQLYFDRSGKEPLNKIPIDGRPTVGNAEQVGKYTVYPLYVAVKWDQKRGIVGGEVKAIRLLGVTGDTVTIFRPDDLTLLYRRGGYRLSYDLPPAGDGVSEWEREKLL